MTSVSVDLSLAEIQIAAWCGVSRRITVMRNGQQNRHGAFRYVGEEWAVDISGTLAEMAVAKYLGHYWQGLANGRGADLAGGVEVRSTNRDDGCLILQTTDADDRPFVLVTGSAPRLVLKGWLLGSAGKRAEHWRKDVPAPAYFVPQSKLCDMAQLRARYAIERG